MKINRLSGSFNATNVRSSQTLALVISLQSDFSSVCHSVLVPFHTKTAVFALGSRACLLLQDRTHTLKSFASSADWIKSLHFGDPKPTADPGVAAERSSKRRKLGSYTGPEPTVEEIEGEFWRVIEAPDDVSMSCWQVACHVEQACSLFSSRNWPSISCVPPWFYAVHGMYGWHVHTFLYIAVCHRLTAGFVCSLASCDV